MRTAFPGVTADYFHNGLPHFFGDLGRFFPAIPGEERRKGGNGGIPRRAEEYGRKDSLQADTCADGRIMLV